MPSATTPLASAGKAAEGEPRVRRPALAGLALAPVVQAARVSIGVEGRTQTIFARAPRLVDAETPLQALGLASRAGEFYVHVQQTSFGPFVDQIGLYPSIGGAGWGYQG